MAAISDANLVTKRQSSIASVSQLHATPVASADFVQRLRDLSQRAYLHRFDQLGKHIAASGCGLLQALQHLRRVAVVARIEFTHSRHLEISLRLGGADQCNLL